MRVGGSEDIDLGLTLYPGLQSPKNGANSSAGAETHHNASALDHERGEGTHQALSKGDGNPVARRLDAHEALGRTSKLGEEDGIIRDTGSVLGDKLPHDQKILAVSKAIPSLPQGRNSSLYCCVPPLGAKPDIDHAAINEDLKGQLPLQEKDLDRYQDCARRNDEERLITLSPKQERRVKPDHSLIRSALALDEEIGGGGLTSFERQYTATHQGETTLTDRCMLGRHYRMRGHAQSDTDSDIGTSGLLSCAVRGQEEAVPTLIGTRAIENKPGDSNNKIMHTIEHSHSSVRGPESDGNFSVICKTGLAIGTNTTASTRSKLGRLEIKKPTSPIFDRFTTTRSPTSYYVSHHSNSSTSTPSTFTSSSIDRHRPNCTEFSTSTCQSGSQPTDSYDRINPPRKHSESRSSSFPSHYALKKSSLVLKALSPNPSLRELPRSPKSHISAAKRRRHSLQVPGNCSDSRSPSSSEFSFDTSDSGSDTETNSPKSIDTKTKLAILKPIGSSLAPRLHHIGITASVVNFIKSFVPSKDLHCASSVPKAPLQASSKVALRDALNAIISVLLPLLPNSDLVSQIQAFIMAFPAQGLSHENEIASSSQPPPKMMSRVQTSMTVADFKRQLHRRAPSPQLFLQNQLHVGSSLPPSLQNFSQPRCNLGALQTSSEEPAGNGALYRHFSPPTVTSSHAELPPLVSHQLNADRLASPKPLASQQPTLQATPTIPEQSRASVPSNSRSQSSQSGVAAIVVRYDQERHMIEAFQENVRKIMAHVFPITENESQMHKALQMSQNVILQQIKIIDLLKAEIGRYRYAAGKWGTMLPAYGRPRGEYLEMEVERLQNALQAKNGGTDQLRKALQVKNEEALQARNSERQWINHARGLEERLSRLNQNPTPPLSTSSEESATLVDNGAAQAHDLDTDAGDITMQSHNMPLQPGEQGPTIDLTQSPELTHTQLPNGTIAADGNQKHTRKRKERPAWIDEQTKIITMNAADEILNGPTINGAKRQKVVQIPAPMNPNILIDKPFDEDFRKGIALTTEARVTMLRAEKERKLQEQHRALVRKREKDAQDRQEKKDRDQKEKKANQERQKELNKAKKDAQKAAAKKRAVDAKARAKAEAEAEAEARKAQEKIEAAQQAAAKREEMNRKPAERAEDSDSLFGDGNDEAAEEDNDEEGLQAALEAAFEAQDGEDEQPTDEVIEQSFDQDDSGNELEMDKSTPAELAPQAQDGAYTGVYQQQDESEESEEE